MADDIVQIGTLKFPQQMTHFSVFEKQYTREVIGLRGTSSNVPTGRNMIHVDFRFNLTGQAFVSDGTQSYNDVEAFRRFIAQLRATPFFPVKSTVLKALIYQQPTEKFSLALEPTRQIDALTKVDNVIINNNKNINDGILKVKDEITNLINIESKTKGVPVPNVTEVYGIVDTFFQDLRFNPKLPDGVGIQTFIDTKVRNLVSKIVALLPNKTLTEKQFTNQVKFNLRNSVNGLGISETVFNIVGNGEIEAQRDILATASAEEQLIDQGFVDSEEDDNVHLAVSNVEWFTHPEIKTGFIVKVSAIYFNHEPYSSQIKYITNDKGTTFDLEKCELFRTYYERYLTDESVTSGNLADTDKERAYNKGRFFDINTVEPTTFQYNLFEMKEKKNDNEKNLPKDEKLFKEAEKRGVVFANEISRVYSNNPLTISGFDDASGSFTQKIECSLTWPLSIIPLQGAAHSTVQFYGKPVGKTAITLHFEKMHETDSIPFDTFNKLRQATENIRTKFNQSSKKYLRYEPILVNNQLINMGGLYYFNVEDISSITQENTEGSVQMTMNLFEQHVPAIEDERKVNGLVDYNQGENLSAHKLTTVMKFLADKGLEEQFSDDPTLIVKAKAEIQERLNNDVLTSDVWFSYFVDNLIPPMFKDAIEENDDLVFKSVETADRLGIFNERKLKLLDNNRVIDGTTETVESYDDFANASPEIRQQLFNLRRLDGKFDEVARITDILATLGLYKDTTGSKADLPFFDDDDLTPSWSSLNQKIKSRSITWTDAENQVARQLILNSRDPLDLYGEGISVSSFLETFFNSFTFGIFEKDMKFIDDEGKTIFHSGYSNGLPIQYAAEKLNLDQSELDEFLSLSACSERYHDYIELKVDLATILEQKFDLKNVKEEFMETVRAAQALDNNSWYDIALAVGLNAALNTARGAVQGAGLVSLDLEKEVKEATKIIKKYNSVDVYLNSDAKAASSTSPKASTKTKDLAKTRFKSLRKVFSTVTSATRSVGRGATASGKVLVKLGMAVGNPVGAATRKLAFKSTLVSPQLKKLVTGSRFSKVIQAFGTRTAGFVGIILTGMIVYNDLKNKDYLADMINAMVSDFTGTYMKAIMFLMLLDNRIPNQDVINHLNRTINDPKNVFIKRELDRLYNDVISYGYASDEVSNTRKFSAYPDFNLPTYRELRGTILTDKDINRVWNEGVEIKDNLELLVDTVMFNTTSSTTSFISKVDELKKEIQTIMAQYNTFSPEKIEALTQQVIPKLRTKLTGVNIQVKSLTFTEASVRIRIGTILSQVNSLLENLLEKSIQITPGLLNSLIPSYSELGIEPPYSSSLTVRSEDQPARTLDDYVDPTFYIARDTVNPFTALLDSDNEMYATIEADGRGKDVKKNDGTIVKGITAQEAYLNAKHYKDGVRHNQEDPERGDPDAGTKSTTEVGPPPMSEYIISKTGETKEFLPTDKHAFTMKNENGKDRRDKYLYNLSALGRFNQGPMNNMGRAFPTFSVFFIKENENLMTERHLVADFYLYQNIIDISINRDKLTGSVATLTMSNIWGTFDNDTFKRDVRQKKPGEKIKESEIAKKFRYSEINLQEGTLIQIKQGYSPNFDELENVFTGKIAEVSNGDIVTLICQGHEHELMNRTREDLDVGLTTGQNYYDYAAQIMQDTKHFGQPFSSAEAAQIIQQRRSHYKQIKSSRDLFQPSSIFSNFLVSNFDTSRATENVWIPNHARSFIDWMMFNDFKIRDESKLEALHEIARYHHTNVCLPLPYDSRSTLFMGPPSHPYKYTSKRDRDLVAYQDELNRITPYFNNINDIITEEDLVNEPLLNDLIEVIRTMPGPMLKSLIVVGSAKKKLEVAAKIKKLQKELREEERRTGIIPQPGLGLGYYNPNIRGDLASVQNIEIDILNAHLDVVPKVRLMLNDYRKANPQWKTTVFWDAKPPEMDIPITDKIGYTAGTDIFKDVPISYKMMIVKAFLERFISSNYTSRTRRVTAGQKYGGYFSHDETTITSPIEVEEVTAFLAMTSNSPAIESFRKLANKDAKVFNAETDGTILRLVRSLENSSSQYTLREFTASILGTNRDHSDFITNFKMYYFLCCGIIAKHLESTASDETSVAIKHKARTDEVITQVTNTMQHIPGYKPFRNHHLVTDRDIVRNEIQCTVASMANEVHVMTPKPNTDFVQKAWDLAAGVLVDVENNESYWRNQVASFCVFQAPSEKIIRRIVEPNAYTLTQQINISFRRLADAMKPMYRGQITLIGRRDIKPYDIIHLKDRYHNVFGAIEVAKVTHNHTLKEGWTTVVEPHLVNHYGEVEENHLITVINSGISLVEGALMFGGIAHLGKSVLGAGGLNVLGAKSFGTAWNTLSKTGGNVWFGTAITGLNQGFSLWAISQLGDLMRSVTDSDVALDTFLTPQFTTYGRGSYPGLDQETSYLRPVVISPLSKDGQPWVAGLKGTRHYDTEGTFGPLHGFYRANTEAFGRGLSSYSESLNLTFDQLVEDYKRVNLKIELRGR